MGTFTAGAKKVAAPLAAIMHGAGSFGIDASQVRAMIA
jgi:hypothetical protein